jgi:hypothetical protein
MLVAANIWMPRAAGAVMLLQRFAASLLTALLMFALVLPLAAEPDTVDQAAVRARLVKWTDDFNAGKVEESCDLFARSFATTIVVCPSEITKRCARVCAAP